jgi:hypothetical protein
MCVFVCMFEFSYGLHLSAEMCGFLIAKHENSHYAKRVKRITIFCNKEVSS